ncbi:MAG: hypothetical protein V3R25_09980 [Nitrosomonadaceae bacterium]
MGWLSRAAGALLGTDKAVSGVVDIAKQGMDMWDMSNLTQQEKLVAFRVLVKETASKETAISRRIIVWSLTAMIAFALVVGTIWISFGATERVDSLIELVEALKIAWAWGAGVTFYFLAHLTIGGKK